MKKSTLFFGLLLSMALSSWKPSQKKNETEKHLAQTVDESLNGIPHQKALDEITDFGTNYYNIQKLQQLDFWYGINVIKEIVKLLHDEISAQDAAHATHKVDGVRIYFVHDATSKYGISLVFVTTVDSVDSFGRKLHHDYYLHADSEQLFHDNYANGTPSSYKDKKPGERLFSGDLSGAGTGCAPGDPDPGNVNTIDAYNMVRDFGSDIINTEAEWYPTSLFEKVLKEGGVCDGIRIYLVRHPDSATVDFKNRDGFIITTTQKDTKDSTNHNDYFYCAQQSGGHGFNKIKKFRGCKINCVKV